VLAVIVAGSMLSVAYSARFHLGAFVAPRRRGRALLQDRKSPDFNILLITASLAVPTVVLGLVPSLGEGLASASVRSLDPNAGSANLALWHGFNLPLVLSALTLAGGWVLGRANRPVQQTLATGSGIPRGEEVYLRLLRGVGRLARGVTAVVQNGSLPVYAAVILLTAVLLPASVLVGSWDWPGWPSLGPVTDVPIVAVLAIAALGAASVRRRFSAAVFLGVVGYSMAALFVTYGAPDLALTQVVVETLSTVVFVLVLRRLPDRFERQSSPRRRALRLAIAGIVGIVVFTLALVAGATRTDNSVSDDMIARSVPDGHGRNVVNVILVDFRALDTLGESTVLAAASIGAVALARVGRRAAEERAGGRHMLASSSETGLRRIVFVDVPAWAIFHLVLMASLWLLFAGHNQPGGGFVGGLLAGAAITLRYVAGGIAEVRGRSRFRPWTVLGVGLLLAGITALLPLLTGGEILDVDVATITMPLLGDLSLSSALLFDGGIYLAVVGIVLMAFEAFGEDPVRAAT
jgi:multicomponent Na+:H+ antiporter subunit A